MIHDVETVGTLFSGGGGYDAGAIMAGAEPIWAIEYDPNIADVYRLNFGNHIITADILSINVQYYLDLHLLLVPDLLHASPPCPNFSNAKAKKKLSKMTLEEWVRHSLVDGRSPEAENDLRLARKIREFIRVMRPRYFSLENVAGYRHSLSFVGIVYQLEELGYAVQVSHLNSADYGVPQTRSRLILTARRDGMMPDTPHPTHAQEPIPSLFGTPDRWVGWHEAITPMVQSLPSDEFAPWQLARLPKEFHTLLISGGENTNFNEAYEGKGCIQPHMPAPTVTAISKNGGNLPRALLLDSKNAGQEWGKLYREEEEPANTVTLIDRPSHFPRALLVDSAGYVGSNGRSPVMRQEDEPANVVVANHERRPMRGFVVDGKLSTSGGEKILQINRDGAHRGTVVSSPSAYRDTRACVNGRVVRMTPRALAQFQSFPLWYKLPKEPLSSRKVKLFLQTPHMPVADPFVLEWLYTDERLSTTIIGNAVPPLLAKAIVGSFYPGDK